MKELLLVAALFVSASTCASNFKIDYLDEAGVGFKSTEPFSPTNTNPSTTLGEARKYILERTVEMISTQLTISTPIYWGVSFDEIPGYGAMTIGPSFFEFTNTSIPDEYGIFKVGLSYPLVLRSSLLNLIEREPYIEGDNDANTRFTKTAENYNFDTSVEGQRFAANVLHELVHVMGFSTLDCLNECIPAPISLHNHYNQFVFVESDYNTFWNNLSIDQKNTAGNIPDILYFKGSEETLNYANTVLEGGVSAENGIQLHSGMNDDGTWDGQSVGHFSPNVAPLQLMHSAGKNVLDLGAAAYILCDIGWCRGTGFVSDLKISISNKTISPTEESTITYEIANLSTKTVSDIVIELDIPQSMNVITNALPDNCSILESTLSCTQSELLSQEYRDIDITISAPAGTYIIDSKIYSNDFVVDINGENNMSLDTITSEIAPFPVISVEETYTFNEGASANITPTFSANSSDNLSFNWEIESGYNLTFTQDSDSGVLTFTAPDVRVRETTHFKLTMTSNGRTETKSIEVKIAPVTPPKDNNSDGGGGGSTNLFMLTLLVVGLIRKQTCNR